MSNQRDLRRGQYGGHRRIAMPNEINVALLPQPGPWAAPVVGQAPLPDGRLGVFAFGGLTREEAIAAPILAALAAADSRGELTDTEGDAPSPERLANAALDLAETLLEVSTRRAMLKVEQSQAEANKPAILED